jgi:hypothetical protein
MQTTTDRTRDMVAAWMLGVPVVASRAPFQPFAFTPEQQHAQAKQEAALRNQHRRQLHEARMRVGAL